MPENNPIKLSIIVPVYNEKGTILEVLQRVKNLKLLTEIIVVDNKSTDGTRELLKTVEGIDRLILQDVNLGKGNSIRTAIPYLRGEFTVIQDADLEYNPESFNTLLDVAEKKQCDVVYGSRLREGVIRTRYVSYYGGVKFLTFMINLLYGSNLTDTATTYKMIKTSILKGLPLKCLGFDLDFELTCQILKSGQTIVEVPVPYVPRSFKEGKKIRASDGLISLWTIIKNRF